MTNDDLLLLKLDKLAKLESEIALLKQNSYTSKTNSQIYDVYILQSRNVRKLSKVKNIIIRDLNLLVRRNNEFEIEVKTKLLSLLYSAWSEAQFVQILHTPKGFFPRDINSISDQRNRNGIITGWRFMVDLAITKVCNEVNSVEMRGRGEKLKLIIEGNIESQSILRNKIAHGQWVHALNRSHTAEGPQTSELNSLDYVQIDRLFEIHKHLGLIVRDLVQSPSNGFHNNFHNTIVKLEVYESKTKDWSLHTRRESLNRRPSTRES